MTEPKNGAGGKGLNGSVDEASFQALFGFSPLAVFVVDVESGDPDSYFFLAANQAALDNYGYTMEELRRMRILDLHPAEDRASVREMMGGQNLGMEPAARTLEPVRHITKGGSIIYVDVFAHSFTFLDRPARLAVIQDVTRRITAQERSQVFSAALEAAPLGIHLVNTDGRIIYANQAAVEMFGYSLEETLGMMVANLKADPKHSVDVVIPAIREHGQWSGETVGRRKDGSEFPMSLSTRMVCDSHGVPLAMLGINIDISDEKVRANSILESEERYRMLVERTHVGVTFTQGGRLVFVNSHMADMLGYTVEEMTGHSPLEFIHPDDVALMAENMQKRVAGEDADDEYIVRATRRDGSTAILNIIGSLVQWQGQPASLGAVVDIARQVAVEDELRQSEERYRMLVERNHAGVTLTQDNKLIFVNRRLAEIFGYEVEEMIGRSPAEFLHPEDVATMEENMRRRQAGEPAPDYYPVRAYRKNGELAHLEILGSLIQWHGKPASLGSVLDVTDRVRAEEAIKLTEVQYMAMFEAQSDAVFIVDKEGVIADVNPAACETYDYAYHDLLGRDVHDLIGPEYLHLFEEAREAIARGEAYHSQSLDITRKGRRFHTDVRITGFLYKGSPHALVVVRDITALKEAEDVIRRSESDLKAKNEELEAFVYTAAHDLRTPLVSVIGYLDLLKGELSGQMDPEQEYMLRRVAANTVHFDNLLKDLLTFSQSSIRDATRDRVRADTLVERVLEEERAGDRAYPAEVYVAPDLPEIFMPSTKAYQVFKNLVSNSLKFGRPESPLKVEIGHTGNDAPEGFVEFFLRDNGIGIDPELHGEVFKLFYRTRRMDTDGTGVGLAIVKRIVEGEGGAIRLDSTPGDGTTFYFTLPVAHQASE